MKNWNTLEADIDLIMNKHYTTGRSGRRIDKVIIHHNAGNLSIRGCWDVWQPLPLQGSDHALHTHRYRVCVRKTAGGK